MAGKVIADTWENGDGTENFKCRAWVNFNGTGTVSIRASGNVSSITDNGVGDYTINFTNNMEDSNYSFIGTGSTYPGGGSSSGVQFAEKTLSSTTLDRAVNYCKISTTDHDGINAQDVLSGNVSVFR